MHAWLVICVCLVPAAAQITNYQTAAWSWGFKDVSSNHFVFSWSAQAIPALLIREDSLIFWAITASGPAGTDFKQSAAVANRVVQLGNWFIGENGGHLVINRFDAVKPQFVIRGSDSTLFSLGGWAGVAAGPEWIHTTASGGNKMQLGNWVLGPVDPAGTHFGISRLGGTVCQFLIRMDGVFFANAWGQNRAPDSWFMPWSSTWVASSCAAASNPTNGAVSCTSVTNGANKETAVCTFSCNNGYQLLGQSAVTCLHTGAWSSPFPTCITPYSAIPFTQWSNAASSGGQFIGTSPGALFTLVRYGDFSAQTEFRGSMAIYKSSATVKCGDSGFVDAQLGTTKGCDTRPGDLRNFQADYYNYLGSVNPSGSLSLVSDNDPRWILLGGPENYDLPAGKTYVVRYGATGGFVYRNFQGRFRCSDYWLGDPLVGTNKQCWYWAEPNNYLTPTSPADASQTAKGQWVDCALRNQDCVPQTDERPYWVRVSGYRNGVLVAAFGIVDSSVFQCSNSALSFDDVSFESAMGGTAFRCAWFKPEVFHYNPSGYWASVVSGPQSAGLSYKLTYGVDSSRATEDTKAFSHSVTTAVGGSLKFGSASVGYAFSTTAASSIGKGASVHAGNNCELSTCVGSSSWSTKVLWAWKIDIGEVCGWGNAGCLATVNTCNFWCTSSTSKPPKCPVGACADLECQTCVSWT